MNNIKYIIIFSLITGAGGSCYGAAKQKWRLVSQQEDDSSTGIINPYWSPIYRLKTWNEKGEGLHKERQSNANKKLRRAAINGSMDKLIEALNDEDADVNSKGIHGRTPLIWASLNGHTDIVAQLIAREAKINSADEDGHTALMEAATAGYVDVMELLLQAGARMDLIDKNGSTALSLAITYEQKKAVIFLINHHANTATLSADQVEKINEWIQEKSEEWDLPIA